jgi:ABC-type transport system involved in cytochrome bd biosynthesis fused ATPase/permease subunit
VTVAQDALLRIRLPWVYAICSVTAVVVLLACLSPAAALVVALHALICCGVARFGVARAVRSDSLDAASARGAMAAESAALASTSRDLVAYGGSDTFTRRVHTAITTQERAQGRAGWVAGAGSGVVMLLTGAATALVALSAGRVEPVMAGVLVLAPVALLEPLLSVMEAERLRPSVQAARARLAQLDTLESPVIEPVMPVSAPSTGILVMTEVVPRWGAGLTQPVTFALRPGDVIGLTGPSGLGKSTLALTMVKLIEPVGGLPTLDGIDYRDLDGTDVRTRVGLCGQDDVLFDTTVRENLRIASPGADEATMTAVLRRVGLGPLLDRMSTGVDTPVGPHGTSLSGGERQRLCMARLLLAGHRVLVFDEPTEHLDQQAASQMLADIVSLRADHAIVLISHSPTVLDACDHVVRLAPAANGRAPAASQVLSHA